MSDDLIAFLKAWHDWATNGAPDKEPFYREYGLCDNVEECPGLTETSADSVTDELIDFFKLELFPFGADDYDERYYDRTQHECPKRLAWVRERLVEAGELVA